MYRRCIHAAKNRFWHDSTRHTFSKAPGGANLYRARTPYHAPASVSERPKLGGVPLLGHRLKGTVSFLGQVSLVGQGFLKLGYSKFLKPTLYSVK